jgi:hypothetical protein
MSSAETRFPPAALPDGQLLFYQRPEALTAERHGDLCLKRNGDFTFSRVTNSVAITSTEFIAAMRSYPIVFAARGAYPVVVLGLEQKNLFVDEAGIWRIGHYIPAYIRRYPFVFIAHPDGQQFVLGIDRASTLLENGGDGRPLFESDKPAEVTRQALSFCSAFQTDHDYTRAFGAALEEQNILIDNQAQVKLPNGKAINLSGFRIVDRQKFASLPDAVIVEWHKKGWAALVYYHLASLERFQTLLELVGTSGEN